MTDFPAVNEKDRYQHVQLVDSNGVPFKSIPDSLITSGGPNGRAPRLRVDSGQTGFFDGRMFRSQLEGVIPVAGPVVNFKFTAPVDFILWSQNLDLTQGALELKVYAGAVGAGVWTEVPTVGVNRMGERPQPYYDKKCKLEIGGTFTGGTRTDIMRKRSASNNANASNVGGAFSERGLPATTFFGSIGTLTGGLTVNDAAQYIYELIWEERT